MVPVGAENGGDVVKIAAFWAVLACDEVVEEVVDASLDHAGREATGWHWRDQVCIGIPCLRTHLTLGLLLFLGSLDGLAGLVAEDQLPLVPVSRTFLP